MDAIVVDNGSFRIRCGVSNFQSNPISELNLAAAFKRQLPNNKGILFGNEISKFPLTRLTLRSGFEKVCIYHLLTFLKFFNYIHFNRVSLLIGKHSCLSFN